MIPLVSFFLLLLGLISETILIPFWGPLRELGGANKLPTYYQLYARDATAAPKVDRQIQIEEMFFLEAVETANQQTVPKLTPKTIRDATKMKPRRAKGPSNAINFVFRGSEFCCEKGRQTRQTPVSACGSRTQFLEQNESTSHSQSCRKVLENDRERVPKGSQKS